MVVIVDVSILRVGYDLATLRFEASLLLLLQQRLVAPPFSFGHPPNNSCNG